MLAQTSQPPKYLPREENGNKYKHRRTHVGGLSFYPHLTGEVEVRFVFGRELSSPVGPLGLRRIEFVCVCVSVWLSFKNLFFVLFFSPCCFHEQSGSFSSISPHLLVRLLECSGAFFFLNLKLFFLCFVSNCQHTETSSLT